MHRRIREVYKEAHKGLALSIWKKYTKQGKPVPHETDMNWKRLTGQHWDDWLAEAKREKQRNKL